MECIVRVHESEAWVETIFPDGVSLLARPNYDPDSISLARELGYPSVVEMTMAHDPMHSIIAAERGEPWCPVLFAVAHRLPVPKGWWRIEREVLERQRASNE